MKVSVIVPAFNAEQYIEKCAMSILNQTLRDIEVIFIDDGSTDKTGEILDKIGRAYSRMRVIHQENRGLYATRRIGIELATGEYIGWVDADDFVASNMFEKLYITAIENNSELVYCDYSFYPEKIKTKEKWFRPYEGKCDVDFVERNNQPWNKLVKRELLENLGIGQMFETCFDEAYIKVLIHARNPVSIDEKLYFYRVGDGSMSSSYKNVDHYMRFIQASKNLKRTLSSENAYWQEYFNYRIVYYTLMTMLVAANAEDKDSYCDLRRTIMSSEEYKKNRFIDHILKMNYGSMKAFAIKNLIIKNYAMASILARMSIGRR